MQEQNLKYLDGGAPPCITILSPGCCPEEDVFVNTLGDIQDSSGTEL